MKRSMVRERAAWGLATAVAAAAILVAPAEAGRHGDDLVRTAQKAGSFRTLVHAIHRAGLTRTLKLDGDFTVFAPSDEAFAKLPAGALESLLRDREALRSVLLYHVVDGKVTSDQVAGLSEATTLNGQKVSIAVAGGVVKVNDATVTAVDVMAENGVIHVIDTVLLPR